MRGGSWLLSLLVALPPAMVAWGAARCADSLGSRIGGAIAQWMAWNPGPTELPPRFVEPDPDVLAAGEASLRSPGAGGAKRFQPAASTGARWLGSSAVRAPTRGIRVRADTVLRLADAGLRPHGFPVPATEQRPAGIALAGVGALGIGLRDGDVLTLAAGRPALHPGDVIGAVIASRGARVSEISGRFWRDGEPWNLVVEQPYLQPRSRPVAAAAPPDADRDAASMERTGPTNPPCVRAKRPSGPSDGRNGPEVGAASRAQAAEPRARG